MCLQSREAIKSSEKELGMQGCRSRAIICIQARISTAAILFKQHKFITVRHLTGKQAR